MGGIERALALPLWIAAGLYFAWAVVETFNLFVPLTMGDHTLAGVRWDDLQQGRYGVVDFLFYRHGEHNHAIAMLAAYLDNSINHGRTSTFILINIVSNAAFGIGMLALAARLALPPISLALLALFAASQISALGTVELWVHPFQIVVTAMRPAMLAAYALFFYGALRDRPAYLYGAAALALTVQLSHGSGLMGLVLLLAFALLLRSWRGAAALAVALALGVAHDLAYPAYGTPLIASLKAALAKAHQAPLRVLYMLGHFVTWPECWRPVFGTPATNWALAFGAAGVAAYAALALRGLLRARREPAEMALIALATFAFIACSLSVVMNFGRSEAPPLNYFVASRYTGFTSIFWISTMSLALAALPSAPRLALCAVALLSVFLSTRDPSGLRVLLQNQYRDRIQLLQAIMSGTTDQLSVDELARGMAVGAQWPRPVLERNITILRTYRLSPFR